MALTEEQEAALRAAAELKEGEILKIEACAGSGKTSTLIEIAKSRPEWRFLYLAFNRAIVEEARRRFPPNVRIFTTHSLAYHWYIYAYGREAVRNLAAREYRVFDIEKLFPGKTQRELTDILRQYRAYLQSALTEAPPQVERILEAVKKGELPLTHDYYLKRYQLEFQPKFRNHDCVLLDEAQDTNAVTMAIFMDNPCRKIVVGDSHQGIYAFRGAVNALRQIRAARTVHLSCSFRSEQPILDRANFFLQRYAPDRQLLIPMTSKARPVTKVQSEALIARTNAGIVERIAAVHPARLKDYRLTRPAEAVFAGTMSVLAFKEGRKADIEPAYKWLCKFDGTGELADYAEDCHDFEVSGALKLIDKWGGDLRKIRERALTLDRQTDALHVLTTAHSAKGLEWDAVTLHDDFPDLPAAYLSLTHKDKEAMSPEAFEQELNLYYVAVTRARSVLKDLTANGIYYEDRLFTREAGAYAAGEEKARKGAKGFKGESSERADAKRDAGRKKRPAEGRSCVKARAPRLGKDYESLMDKRDRLLSAAKKKGA